jgi:fructoselysine-6-P-deglycase FrlB-like protein
MSSTQPFDPRATLAGPPDPWASAEMPTIRQGPPYHMTDMIAAEPAVAERLLERLADPAGPAAALAGVVREAAAAGAPVVLTGCGTSEHAALAAMAILREALDEAGVRRATLAAVQAFELALDPPSSGLVIGISHEGATPATNAALEAARSAGARTAIVTVSERSPGGRLADVVVPTEELDQGWCHVVGYLAPILAVAAVGGHVSGRAVDVAAAARILAAGAAQEAAAEAMAARFAAVDQLLVVASGSDRPAGRELALKIEEGTWLPAAYRDLETVLHGHLAATNASTGLVVVLVERAGREQRAARAAGVLRAAGVIGIPAAAILAGDVAGGFADELTPAGRLIAGEATELPGPVAALLGTATPLQLLAERLARARGTNPDQIHRDDPRYAAAADAAEGA